MTLEAAPRAKINLGLWIHSRREDGFHELSTVFQEIPLADRLEFDPDGTTGLDCSRFGGPDNLVEKARRALEERVGRPLPGRFTLHKTIPAAAGLGGGSSDGAAALRLLDEGHGLGLGTDELERIAARFGSDTSFFVRGGCQVGRGRGEELTPCIPYSGLILVGVPVFGLSTADVFRELTAAELTPDRGTASMVAEALGGGGSAIRDLLANNLQAAAQRREPRLKTFLNYLGDRAGSRAWMSGSGSSCFSLPEHPPAPPTSFNGALLALCDTRTGELVWKVGG